MKKKRLLSIIAACSVILTGCGTSDTDTQSHTSTIPIEQSTKPPTPEPTAPKETEPLSLQDRFDSSVSFWYVSMPAFSTWKATQGEDPNVITITDESDEDLCMIAYGIEHDPTLTDYEILGDIKYSHMGENETVSDILIENVNCLLYQSSNQPYLKQIFFVKNHMFFAVGFPSEISEVNMEKINYMIANAVEIGDINEYYKKYNIFVSDYRLSKNGSGDDVLIVDYKWTNYSDEPEIFAYNFSTYAYQNGMECDDGVYFCDDYDREPKSAKVLPGATVTVQDAFVLRDMSDVTLNITEWLDDSDVKYQKTISLQ